MALMLMPAAVLKWQIFTFLKTADFIRLMCTSKLLAELVCNNCTHVRTPDCLEDAVDLGAGSPMRHFIDLVCKLRALQHLEVCTYGSDVLDFAVQQLGERKADLRAVHSLRLNGRAVKCMADLEHFFVGVPRLASLRLEINTTPFKALQFLRSIAHACPLLRELVLWVETDSDTMWPHLRPESVDLGLASLEALEWHWQYSAPSLDALASDMVLAMVLESAPSLKRLHLDRLRLSCVRALTAVRNFPPIETFTVPDVSNSVRSIMASLAKRFAPTLKHVHSRVAVSDASPLQAFLCACSNLESLVWVTNILGNMNVHGPALSAVATSCLHLTSVDCHVVRSDVLLSLLRPLPQLKTLKVLVEYGGIKECALIAAHCHDLVELRLAYSRNYDRMETLDFKQLAALANPKGCPKLEEVHFWMPSSIMTFTADNLIDFAFALPALRVLSVVPHEFRQEFVHADITLRPTCAHVYRLLQRKPLPESLNRLLAGSMRQQQQQQDEERKEKEEIVKMEEKSEPASDGRQFDHAAAAESADTAAGSAARATWRPASPTAQLPLPRLQSLIVPFPKDQSDWVVNVALEGHWMALCNQKWRGCTEFCRR